MPNLLNPANDPIVEERLKRGLLNFGTAFATGGPGVPGDIGQMAVQGVTGLLNARMQSLDPTGRVRAMSGQHGLLNAPQLPYTSEAMQRSLGGDPTAPESLLGFVGAPEVTDVGKIVTMMGKGLLDPSLAMTLLHGSKVGRYDVVPEGTMTNNIRDLFDTKFIGDSTKGEGATAFGHGLYFAESGGVGGSYAVKVPPYEFRGSDLGNQLDKLQRQMDALPVSSDQFIRLQERYQVLEDIGIGKTKKELLNKFDDADQYSQETIDFVRSIKPDEVSQHQVFEVEIPDEVTDRMLDWDAKLGEQDGIAAILNKNWDRLPPQARQNAWQQSGNQWYRSLASEVGGAAWASELLNELGIPGIRYFDAQSRDPFGSDARMAQRAALARIKEIERPGSLLKGKAKEHQLRLARQQLEDAEKGIKRNIVLFDPDEITQVKRDGELVFENKSGLGNRGLLGDVTQPRKLTDFEPPENVDVILYDKSNIYGEPVYELNELVVPDAIQGQGLGSRTMQEMTNQADAEGATIILNADSSVSGRKGSKAADKRLINFYRQHGFVTNTGRNKDFRFGGPTQKNTMYRVPRTK